MAVPGPGDVRAVAGCHALLRDGATCVTRAEEVLDLVGVLGAEAATPLRGPASARDDLPETVRRVLEALPVRGGAGEAALARDAGVSTLVVQQVLPPLLVHGLVERTLARLAPHGPRRRPAGAVSAPGRRAGVSGRNGPPDGSGHPRVARPGD